MIDILLSVRPFWCGKIIALQKPIELRKSRPHGDTPYHIYLYETKQGRGKVVGECICSSIEKAVEQFDRIAMVEGSCLTLDQINAYSKRKPVYGWYLAKVVEYTTPKPLSDFGLQRAPQSWCYIKEAA